jgi:hypothetical protein
MEQLLRRRSGHDAVGEAPRPGIKVFLSDFVRSLSALAGFPVDLSGE